MSDYFANLETGFAIEVARTWRLAAPIPLATLRGQRGGFHAPQSYRYLDLCEVLSMGGEALLGGEMRPQQSLTPAWGQATDETANERE